MVLSSACTATYYTSVLATAIYYLVASFWPTLPWSKCDPNLYLKDGKPRKDVHCDETLQASADFILHYNANESGQVCSSIGNCKKFEFPGNITLTGGNGSQTELYFKYGHLFLSHVILTFYHMVGCCTFNTQVQRGTTI